MSSPKAKVGNLLPAIVAFFGAISRLLGFWGVDQKAKSLSLVDFLILFRERLRGNFWEAQGWER